MHACGRRRVGQAETGRQRGSASETLLSRRAGGNGGLKTGEDREIEIETESRAVKLSMPADNCSALHLLPPTCIDFEQ